MADASEIAKALTGAWIRTGVPSKSATEAVEFYRSIYDELIYEPERSAGESLRFDRYDAVSLLLLVVAAGFILLRRTEE
jgi:hypothetical protein